MKTFSIAYNFYAHSLCRKALGAIFTVFCAQAQTPNQEQLRSEIPNRTLTALQAVTRHSAAMGMGAKDKVEPRTTAYDPKGNLHVLFRRYHQGVRVLNAGTKVMVDGKGQATVNVARRLDFTLPTVVPAVDEVAVKELVARDLQLPAAKMDFATELVIAPPAGKAPARLLWQVRADAGKIRAQLYFVDAMTGAIVKKRYANVEDSNVNGTGTGQHNGIVSLTTRLSGATYKLQDFTRGESLVYDTEDKKPDAAFHGTLYTSNINTWGNGEDWKTGGSTTSPTGQTAAADAMFGSRVTWDLWKNVWGRHGYDNLNTPMKARVHYRDEADKIYRDANWDGYFANFGDGETSDSTSQTKLSTVSHEWGHAMWQHTVEAENEGEAAGLNEGHGDINGAIARHYAGLANAQGGVIPSNEPRNVGLFFSRSVNPWSYQSYSGDTGLPYYVYSVNGSKPMGDHEVHTQGSVYGRIFATLAAGAPSVAEYEAGPACPSSGSHFQCLVSPYLPQGMAGIGIDKAARIWYTATVGYISSEPTFHNVRDAWLAAAEWLYGKNQDEYKSVMNAFRAVNIGDAAEDTQNPSVLLQAPVVNNNEQTAYVDITGSDDTGVVSVKASTIGFERMRYAPKLQGFVDLSKATYGKVEIAAEARDAMGKTGQQKATVAYAGANYIIKNRGFEEGESTWEVSVPGMIRSGDAAGAFLGSGYASFSGLRQIRQVFTAVEASTSCEIGYRVRVMSTEAANTNAALIVELMQADGSTVQQLLQTISGAAATTSATSNGYIAYAHQVNGCNGKRYIRFRAQNAPDERFRVDNAYVTYTAPVTAQLDAVADANEGSVIMQVKNIQNVDPARVKEVRLLQDGKLIHTDKFAPYSSVQSTAGLSPGVVYNVSAQVIDPLDAPLVTVGPAAVSFPAITQLIKNGGFDSGMVWWINQGAAAQCGYNPASGEGTYGFMGTSCVLFTGNGYVEQEVKIPSGGGTAALTFRLYIQKGSAADLLEVTAINPATGKTTALLGIPGNEDTNNTGVTLYGYRKFTKDLSALKGQTVKLRFQVIKTGADPLYFMDNVGVAWTGGPVLF